MTRATTDSEAPAGAPSDIVLASSRPDADAVEQLTACHSEFEGSLARRTTRLVEASVAEDAREIEQEQAALLEWCRGPLTYLLDAERAVFGPVLDLLGGVPAGLDAERQAVDAAIGRLRSSQTPMEIATAALALRLQVGRRQRAFENDSLPILAGSPRVSLASLWPRIESLTASRNASTSEANGAELTRLAAVCECGVIDEPDFPELDVRSVPHAIRHATVFGALDAIGTGEGLILVAPHDPLPLLHQIEQRAPGRFGVSYLQRGPDAWRLRLARAETA